ncbi:putative Ig domain-containing protein [Allofranklinella schreckenbergeri]|uniref:putative Ig domain-containing protein n=1 Tax=Allofranklinella schreckenbergeri TaxID=1076744 RepID=UPI0036F205E6
MLGHWLVDRIYGGAGNDRLDGRGGNDYLEGGSGHDVYVLSASNKGIATVFDTDGQGALQVGHDVLASLSFARADLPVNDGHQAQVFYSTNPEARATYRLSSMPDGQWEFAALLDGAYQPLAHLMHWQNGQLGLQVDFDQRPGLLPQDLRFALDHRNSSLFHNYVGNHAPEGIAVHGGPRSAQFSGSAHGDVIFTGDSLTNLVYAQGGSDYVRGGSGREFILAGMNRADLTGDDDVVYGAGDSDIIYGGGGNDTLWGGDGSLAYLQPLGPAEMANERTRRGDWISAQAGSDWVFGSSAEDVLFGGGGADHVHGGAGDDLILGDADYAVSSSSMPIGGANDGIVAYRWMPDGSIRRLRDGPDAALAIPRGNVFEWQWSQSEQDFTLTPWRNFIREDRVAEKGSDDKLYGGEGNDWIAGQTGDDYLEGGDGDDVLWGDDSQPLPDGGDGNDTLVAGKGQDRLFGGKGDDTLDAREEDGELDKLKGGEGDDTLMGGTGEDVLYGEDGNDVLIAGAETARMEGGDGNDTYISSTGDDVMFDRDGDDDYRLSRGNDAVTDLRGHDVYRIGFGHLAMGGTTVVQDLDGKGEIYYGAGLLSGQGVYAKSEGQWLSLDGQALLIRSGGDLHISNATAGAQSGKVVFTNFFSQDVFLSLELPKYVPPAAPAPVNQAPVAGPALPAQQAQEDAPWSFALPADAFSDPEGQALTYSAARKGGGALPAWLHFDAASGVFSGTPGNDDVGTVVVRVAARDPQGAQAWQEWALEVLNTNDAPEAGAVLTPVAVPAGQALSLVLPAGAFVDVDKGDVLSYSATLGDGSPLPGWLRMDSATGALSGMAPHTSLDTLHALRIVATDQAGEQASQSLLLTVQASGEPVLPRVVPMVGTPGDDTISGTTGDDILSGLEGNDMLYGGAGKDQLFGNEGDDALHGDTGDDQLYGGHGNDELRGWADDDVLNGQDGNDQLYGGDGDDVLFGEAGRDVLHGDAGADTLYGGEGDDELRGWVGDDTLHGDGGADRLYGGQGRDALYGWEGDDLLHGDADGDWLYGGAGADALYGDAGDDQLYGDGGDDLLVGGAGRDVLAGGAGRNQLFGGFDGDLYVIEAGAGSHLIVEEGFAGVDIVQLRALASQDAYTLARVGDDLHLRYGAPGSEQTLMVRGQFAVQTAVEEFHFSDGVILSASDIAQAAGVSKSAWAVNSANSDATWANAAEIALMGLHARELEWGLA